MNFTDCECVTACNERPPTACSLSGIPHVHPDLGRCPVHPDAPGDWPADDLPASQYRLVEVRQVQRALDAAREAGAERVRVAVTRALAEICGDGPDA